MSPPPASVQSLRRRRLAVSGGSRLSQSASAFYECLGRQLAETQRNLTIVTGGLKRRKRSPPAMIAADWAFVRGAVASLVHAGVPVDSVVETVLPERDWDRLERFHEGAIVKLARRTSQARRFAMVHSCDLVVSIGGSNGTRSVLDLALALDRPILPLPFARGISATRWQENDDLIREWFGLTEEDARQLEQVELDGMPEDELEALATRVRDHLVKGFARTCFVIMPFADSVPVFQEVIEPALKERGLQPVRMDRVSAPGDAVALLRQAISTCSGAIADITGNNANVLYELGLAHGENKPVILLCRADDDGRLRDLPFDLQSQSILPYSAKRLDDLRTRLREALRFAFGT